MINIVLVAQDLYASNKDTLEIASVRESLACIDCCVNH